MGTLLMDQYQWTDERVARFKVLFFQTDPVLSFLEIAKELGGPSRSACIGKAQRLGLRRAAGGLNRGNPNPINPRLARWRSAPQISRGDHIAGKVKRTYTSRKTTTPSLVDLFNLSVEQEVVDLPPDQSKFAVSLMDAQEHHCRWPLGEPSSKDFMFCGDQKIEGHSYCLRHCLWAYKPSRPVKTFIPMRSMAA